MHGFFDKWSGAPFLKGLDEEAAAKVSKEYSDAFVRFMKTGNPGEGWKTYDGTEKNLKMIQ